MKTLHYLIAAGAILLFSAFTISNSVNWNVSSEHSVKFSGTDAVGIFKTLTGNVTFDPNQLADASLDFKVKVNSINTGNGMQNKHAVSDKWFDAEQFPYITFKSSKIYKEGSRYMAKGTMTIRGIAKEMTIPFTFSDHKIKADFSVNRLDFKVGTMNGMSKKSFE